MSNMSYCRFQNTASDLRDCVSALNEMNDPEETLSAEEFKAFRRILKMARRLVDDFEGNFED